jgi:hypothetical protein
MLEQSETVSSIAMPTQEDLFQFLYLVSNRQDKLFFLLPASPNPFNKGEMDIDSGANSDLAAQEKEYNMTLTGILAALQEPEKEEDNDARSRNKDALESWPSTWASRMTTIDSKISPLLVSSIGKQKMTENAVSKSAKH